VLFDFAGVEQERGIEGHVEVFPGVETAFELAEVGLMLRLLKLLGGEVGVFNVLAGGKETFVLMGVAVGLDEEQRPRNLVSKNVRNDLTTQPLPPANLIGVGPEPSKGRQNAPLDALVALCQHPVTMSEPGNQFDLTRQASITAARQKRQIPISRLALNPALSECILNP